MAEGNNTTEATEAPAETKPTEEKESKEQESPKKEATPPPNEMKAVVLTGHGGLKCVKVMPRPEPTLKAGEVLIRVKACGLSFLDVMVRQGFDGIINGNTKAPFIMGLECAGEIEQVGEGVEDFKIGDRVAALTENNAWGELAAVPAKFVYKLPEGMSFSDAASMLMSFVVAYILTFDVGGIREGETVFLHSAGSGVGLAMSQLCKLIPNVTLIGTASKHKVENIQEHFNHIIDHSTDYVPKVKEIAPNGVDIAFDCLYGDDFSKTYSLVKPLGRYALFGCANAITGDSKGFFGGFKMWWSINKIAPRKFFDDNKSILGFNLYRFLFHQNGHDYVKNVVEKVFKLWLEKKIKPQVDSCYAFEDIHDAMLRVHERKNIGKIVLDPSKEPAPKPVSTKNKGKGKNKEEDASKKENAEEAEKPADKAEKPAEKVETTEGDAAAAPASK